MSNPGRFTNNLCLCFFHSAPPLGSRSPPKPSSSRERVDTTNLNPERWSVRDTSVNAASAIYQAMSNPNTAWASSSRTTRTSHPPRSTSVEYESQASNNARRLGAPPSRLGSKANNKPLSMNSSSRSIVPDSEGEQSQSQILDYSREKSPFSFDQLTNLAQTAIQKTSYFVREKQREDQQPNGNASYDYSAEEREYQQYERNVNANASSSKTLSSSAVHRKNRISTDNRAYKPSQEELEESSDDDVSDTRRRRRKKGASGPAGGPLTTLPQVGPEKRRKKGSRKTKGGAANGEEEDEEEETDKEQVKPKFIHFLLVISYISFAEHIRVPTCFCSSTRKTVPIPATRQLPILHSQPKPLP